ncbi:MAG: hypothetical protein H7A27_00480 [Spirochaetaceae bacterium]|nr:hypothetical protein [Spirochaetaceae bacterium]
MNEAGASGGAGEAPSAAGGGGRERRVAAGRRRSLTAEIQGLSFLVTMAIVVTTLAAFIVALSLIMRDDLRDQAVKTADEVAEIVAEPLYNLDDSQAVRIAEALIASGRIAGIRITLAEGRVLYESVAEPVSATVPRQSRVVVYRSLDLGTVELYFSDEDVRAMRGRLVMAMLITAAAVAGAFALVGKTLFRRKLDPPIAAMLSGMRSVARGQYDARVPPSGFSDVDAITGVINDMADKVRDKSEELRTLNDELEARVAERTAELSSSLESLRLAQDRLIESSRLAALGHLSAGIAHELNTPLGAILSSSSSLAEYVDDILSNGIERARELSDDQVRLYRRLVDESSSSVLDLDAAIGASMRARGLAARVERAGLPDAEAIAEHLIELGLADRFDELLPSLRIDGAAESLARAAWDGGARRMAEIVGISARKASDVVAALRSYLSREAAEPDKLVRLDADLERVLLLMSNVIKNGIGVVKDLRPAAVYGSSERLSQVWMNLVRNAIQAMDYSGSLGLRSGVRNGEAFVEIEDTGHGIPDDIKDRIFEPYFTTKPGGEGMGLGLDICRRIVETSRGRIEFDSRPGRTVFRAIFPAAREAG